MLETCRWTVCLLRMSRSAISWLLRPWATSRRTSTSRRLRPDRAEVSPARLRALVLYLTQQGIGGASVLPRAKVLEDGERGPRLRLGELWLEFPRGLCDQQASARRFERHPESDELAECRVEVPLRRRFLAGRKGVAVEALAVGHHDPATEALPSLASLRPLSAAISFRPCPISACPSSSNSKALSSRLSPDRVQPALDRRGGQRGLPREGEFARTLARWPRDPRILPRAALPPLPGPAPTSTRPTWRGPPRTGGMASPERSRAARNSTSALFHSPVTNRTPP